MDITLSTLCFDLKFVISIRNHKFKQNWFNINVLILTLRHFERSVHNSLEETDTFFSIHSTSPECP